PSAQGKGLAAEAARALIGMLREHSQVRRLVGITDVQNTASARLLERLGMTFEAEEEIIFRGQPCVEARYALAL
ncbi:MAG TPA: GNAT family protein, partial [Gaiellales bacterium]|nr:GNAT family protein [Gaiellales bacterium]